MDVTEILQNAGLKLTERTGWTCISDERVQFRQEFGTDRLGKLQDGHLYVTVRALNISARRLMATYGFHIEELKTSNGADNAVYPGFNLNQCSAETLARFVKDLRTLVDVELGLY